MCRECCCGMNHHGCERFHVRRFLTREERVKNLERYAEELKKELAGIEEYIKELRNQ